MALFPPICTAPCLARLTWHVTTLVSTTPSSCSSLVLFRTGARTPWAMISYSTLHSMLELWTCAERLLQPSWTEPITTYSAAAFCYLVFRWSGTHVWNFILCPSWQNILAGRSRNLASIPPCCSKHSQDPPVPQPCPYWLLAPALYCFTTSIRSSQLPEHTARLPPASGQKDIAPDCFPFTFFFHRRHLTISLLHIPYKTQPLDTLQEIIFLCTSPSTFIIQPCRFDFLFPHRQHTYTLLPCVYNS